MEKNYFAVIAGAGPAGSFLARLLAQENRPVALLDKRQFPRYKPCGGGVSAKARKLLLDNGADYSHLIQDRVNTVVFTNRCQDPIEVKFDDAIIDMVMREELDHLLMQQAVQSGAEVFTPCKVLDMEQQHGKMLVKTSNGTFNTRYLIGADGANSLVSKRLNYKVKARLGFAVECELEDKCFPHYQGKVQLDHGHIDDGYGWVFPKKQAHLSVGIGSFSQKTKNYRRILDNFLEALELNPKINLIKGHLIPTPTHKKITLGKNNSLLIGDAAALADPLSGEGIYYALRSAILASESLLEENPASYSDKVSRCILPELMQAKKVARLIYTIPGTVHSLLKRDRELAKMLVEIVYGGEQYNNLLKQFIKNKLTINLA
ncbi:geranylgeranyl reductase family protein [Metallumcola ferriviriculae]|uniref:Geranylgeranyl reductase family protein n=1 Tax=Metallumcola ferriviriculae TaxID=3039180 RepID=A0AAU0UP00_9FIRM|nr:geranylgeranyl reductase family protein [Desulfitibacteraceae bacterium MK1]